MRIIFVPQYPTPMRYQSWWFWKLPKEFKKAGFDVKILGAEKAEEMKLRRGTMSMFSPIHAAIEFECAQIDEYMSLDLRDDDILFLADISFPGLFSNSLYHKRPKRAFAYCHATSLNYKDYFESVRTSKFAVESAHSLMFDVVFVGSEYHELKLCWPNTLTMRLPYPPGAFYYDSNSDDYRENLIVSASRPTPQKVDIDMECRLQDKFKYSIIRQDHDSWSEYYRFLGKSKILLITSFEDTFGYQIVDAVLNGCIPLAPTRCAYPEILPREYLYEDEDELLRRLNYILNSDDKVKVPQLLCHEEMENFYSNIIQVMKGEVENE